MSAEDDHSFMLDYLTWMKGSAVKAETLHIYSFGYERNLPLPSIPLTPDSKLKFNLQTSGMVIPSRWSLVVIGEKYVDRYPPPPSVQARPGTRSMLRDQFLKSCESNDVNKVRRCFVFGANVNWKTWTEQSGLHIAPTKNYGELLSVSLEWTSTLLKTPISLL